MVIVLIILATIVFSPVIVYLGALTLLSIYTSNWYINENENLA